MTHDTHRRSHVLLTLGVLFTLGGATRFLPDSTASAEGTASAATVQADETPALAAPGETAPAAETPALPAKTASPEEACFTGKTAALIAQDQWLFDSEEEDLKEEKLALLAWRAELETQTAELKALQETLDTRWAQMQQAADADLKHLAAMYGTMKADQAAAIFNQMDPGFAAGFLRLLPSEQAGLILASMEAGKAYVVSVKLASMSENARTGADARPAP